MENTKLDVGNIWQRFIHTFQNFKSLYREERK